MAQAALIAIGAVSAATALFVTGHVGAAVVAAFALVIPVAVARGLSLPEDSTFVRNMTVGAILVRLAFAAALHASLVVSGRGGALFLDDAGYVQVANDLATAWRGAAAHPDLDPSFDHNYVRVAAALFYVFGRDVLAVKFLNTMFGVLAALFAYSAMSTLRLPGRRVALIALLAFPSLVLWASLTLKDAYVLCFALMAVWSVTEFVRSQRYGYMLVTIAALLAIENVRAYLFVMMALLWPLALLIALPRRRLPSVASAGALAAVLLISTNALHYLNPNIITAPTYVRRQMAVGARSGFVQPNPVLRALPCDRYIVTVPDRTAVPDPTDVPIPAGHELVIAGASPRASAVSVRPGDVIFVQGATPCPTAVAAIVPTPEPTPTPGTGGGAGVIEPPTPTPPSLTPAPAPRATATLPIVATVVVVGGAPNVVATPAPPTEDQLALPRGVAENLAHLPWGFLFLVIAPFPLFARSATELAAVPEMLVWYAAVGAAAFGVRRLWRARDTRYAYGFLLLGALALLLSLVEGNVGTLVRHRGMLIPYVVTLAAVGVAAWPRLPRTFRDDR